MLNLFINTRVEGCGALEATANFVLAPVRLLWNGKTVEWRKNGEAHVKSSFKENEISNIKKVLAIIALPLCIPIGFFLKVISHLSEETRNVNEVADWYVQTDTIISKTNSIGTDILADIKESPSIKKENIVEVVNRYTDKLSEKQLFSGGILVAVGDQPIFQKFHSVSEQTFDEKTLFNSCSVSKLFTAIAIHQLENDPKLNQSGEKLNLDQKIGNLQLQGIDLNGFSHVTIRELINHTSGILDRGPENHEFIPSERGKFNYSNYGYQLLSEIVAQKSIHQSFHIHVKYEIAIKAKMHDSLGLTAQFSPSLPTIASPNRDLPSYLKAQEVEKETIQNKIDKLKKSTTTAITDKQSQQLALLKEELHHLQLPKHLEPLISGQFIPHSFITPPAGNGCWDISLRDWFHFYKALINNKLHLDALQSNPVKNTHVDPIKDAKYCAGFEQRPTRDGKGVILYRTGDSPGASASFSIIQYPNREPITVIVSSNLGESRGCIVGDEICDLIQGKQINQPVEKAVTSQNFYHQLMKSENDEENLIKLFKEMHQFPLHWLLPIPQALAREGKVELATMFFLKDSPIPKEAQYELKDRIGDILFIRGKDLIASQQTQNEGKENIQTAKELYTYVLNNEPSLQGKGIDENLKATILQKINDCSILLAL